LGFAEDIEDRRQDAWANLRRLDQLDVATAPEQMNVVGFDFLVSHGCVGLSAGLSPEVR
jgi:hypothetical protein